MQSDHFSSRLSFGDTQTVWARTGYLGFLRRTELTDANGGERAHGPCVGPGVAEPAAQELRAEAAIARPLLPRERWQTAVCPSLSPGGAHEDEGTCAALRNRRTCGGDRHRRGRGSGQDPVEPGVLREASARPGGVLGPG